MSQEPLNGRRPARAVDDLRSQFADMLNSLAKLFETRSLIAQRRSKLAFDSRAHARAQAYEEAMHEVRTLASKLRD